jgi:hypothetical protein
MMTFWDFLKQRSAYASYRETITEVCPANFGLTNSHFSTKTCALCWKNARKQWENENGK